MGIPVKFEKSRGEYLNDCLANGRAIEAPKGGWDPFDTLLLAGACHHAAMSHGPPMLSGRDASELMPERREAVEETFLSDVQAAIGFYSQLCLLLHHGEYDEAFEPHVRAVVGMDSGGDVKCTCHPVEGFKDLPEEDDTPWTAG